MTLLVLGASQALATAVLAATTSSEDIIVVAYGTRPPLPTHAVIRGETTQISLTDSVRNRKITACIIVAEASALPSLVRTHETLLRNMPVLLAPGGLAGALRMRALSPTVAAAEATGFPAAGTHQGTVFTVHGIKHNLPFSSAEQCYAEDLIQKFRRYIPGLVLSDLATTSLSNTNHLIHPPITLVNAVQVDRAQPFSLYREGISSALGNLLDAVDDERRQICRQVGADDRSGRDWMLGFYATDGMHGDTLLQCLASYPGFETVLGPTTLNYRYLNDDIPFGMGQWAALGRHVGIHTPTIDHVVGVLRALAPRLELNADTEALKLFLGFLRQHKPLAVTA